MNSLSTLEEKFSRKTIQKIIQKKIRDIEWRADEARKEAALFYHLPDKSEEALAAMNKRLAESRYGVVVVNDRGLDSKLKSSVRDGVFVEEEEFFELKSSLADLFYPLPEKKFLAVTGTNGKTTTVDIIRQILVAKKVGVLTVGTLGVYLNDDKLADFNLTTPDYIDLRKTLSKYSDEFEVCALEASSHAIEQKRLHGIKFDAVGWTSFSQDHLDYHGSMEAYFEAKKKLLLLSKGPFIISCLSEDLKTKLGDDASESDNASYPSGEFFKSRFNKVNLDVALGCLKRVEVDASADELEKISPPPGRFNIIKRGEQLFVIDFAHTPDALENICGELKSSFPEKILVCVFGCGGNRDKAKRPLMGAAAGKFADYVILTSDNPRFEKPEEIINDIVPGLEDKNYVKVTNRAEAIEKAVVDFSDAVILIAGKGHEPYIDISGEKRPYSDQAELERILQR